MGAIGQPLRRKEDVRLLTGKGRFSDDFSIEGQAYAVMVRSPHPHARIVRVNAAPARSMPVCWVCSAVRTASPTALARSHTVPFHRPDTT